MIDLIGSLPRSMAAHIEGSSFTAKVKSNQMVAEHHSQKWRIRKNVKILGQSANMILKLKMLIYSYNPFDFNFC